MMIPLMILFEVDAMDVWEAGQACRRSSWMCQAFEMARMTADAIGSISTLKMPQKRGTYLSKQGDATD